MGVEKDISAASCNGDALLLISWNVAGWTTTHTLIRRHYTGLAEYLERLGRPAFFCLQEAKVQAKDLRNQIAAQELGAKVKGYRSFWAFNEDKTPRGVATWVRDDIQVLGATQRALGVPEFDQQGRTLLTDHGFCAVLNVYAPWVSYADVEAVSTKLRFLEALGRTMESLRSSGKRVILCGDLNLTHRPADQKLDRRLLWVDVDGRVSVGNMEATLGPFPEWKEQWKPVREICEASSLAAEQLVSSAECIHIREGGCVPWLRSLVRPDGEAPWADIFAEVHPEAQDRFTTWVTHNNLRYTNTGTRLDYVIVDRATFAQCVHRTPSTSLPGGVPAADATVEAQQGKGVDEPGVVATSARAAANAATHFDGWHAAANIGMAQGDGLSLQVDDMRLNDTQFPAVPYTGLIYTPPSYSDHVAVSVLFNEAFWKAPMSSNGVSTLASAQIIASLAEPADMKRSQPWLAQPSIASFFSATPRRNDKPKEHASGASPLTPAAPAALVRASSEANATKQAFATSATAPMMKQAAPEALTAGASSRGKKPAKKQPASATSAAAPMPKQAIAEALTAGASSQGKMPSKKQPASATSAAAPMPKQVVPEDLTAVASSRGRKPSKKQPASATSAAASMTKQAVAEAPAPTAGASSRAKKPSKKQPASANSAAAMTKQAVPEALTAGDSCRGKPGMKRKR